MPIVEFSPLIWQLRKHSRLPVVGVQGLRARIRVLPLGLLRRSLPGLLIQFLSVSPIVQRYDSPRISNIIPTTSSAQYYLLGVRYLLGSVSSHTEF